MVFSGQASPVILSDDELAELEGADDSGAGRGRFTAPDRTVELAPRRWDLRVATGAILTVMVLVGMLPVAFGLALATP